MRPGPLPPRRDLAFVVAQFVLLAGILFAPRPLAIAVPGVWRLGFAVVEYCALAFGAVAVLQLGSNLTPWPSPRSGATLVTGGVYAVARHPIYAALLAFSLAVALREGSPLKMGLALALAVLIAGKARYEERLLAARYPAYPAYAKRVKRFGL